MPNFNGKISGFVVGDDLEVYRTITNVPTGETVIKAWFTVKINQDDTDAAALFQKVITDVIDFTQGEIADAGALGTAILRFFLTADDTATLGNPTRAIDSFFYDIQVKTVSDRIYTPETGKITPKPQVTFTDI